MLWQDFLCLVHAEKLENNVFLLEKQLEKHILFYIKVEKLYPKYRGNPVLDRLSF